MRVTFQAVARARQAIKSKRSISSSLRDHFSLLPTTVVALDLASIVIMPDTARATPFPSIDTDPHFRRVVGNFRQSDYAAWAGGAAFFPGALYMMELTDSTRAKPKSLGSALRLATFLGACGGFLLAYQRSSFRLWGWTENSLELSRAEKEPGYGTDPSKSDLDPYMQGVAHRNSAFSQLKFSTVPWFNFVHHPHHGPQQFRGEESSKEKE